MNFDYKNGFRIQNLSLKIEENSIYALTGNNGSGKTTLLRLLVGLLKPKSGTIKIFEEVLTRNKMQLWKIRQKIGFLFQNPDDQLFSPTVWDEIAYGPKSLDWDHEEITKQGWKAVKLFDLDDYVNTNIMFLLNSYDKYF